MKFNKLNSVRHTAGTKYPPNWCCAIIEVSVYTRGHVAATYPWDMHPQHFDVCANVVILSLLHAPATRPCYMSPQCVLHKFLSLQHVAATCPCNMTSRVCPPEENSLKQLKTANISSLWAYILEGLLLKFYGIWGGGSGGTGGLSEF